jgi:pimeloyl-ACP methyl ester carboxylesterase
MPFLIRKIDRLIRLTVIMIIVLCAAAQNTAAQSSIKNVVIVHGAFADASGWEEVYRILTAKGLNVSLVQNPLTSLEDDVAATKRVLDKQTGPVVLVGHSWGGTVITQAGADPKVVRLVYVAAFAPAIGESTLDLVKWAPPAPENGILPPDTSGFIWYDKAKFHDGFAADLPKSKTDFMFASCAPIHVRSFITPISTCAWKTKPSWAIVATEDKRISPETERALYKRMGATVKEIKGSHVIFMSKAKEVADVIEAATR